MDVHKGVEGLTAKAVVGAHQWDFEVQDKQGVKYLQYWFNEANGTVFCLCEAPSKEAVRCTVKPTVSLRTKSSR
jgi:uncharacterized protein (DUF2237 family)